MCGSEDVETGESNVKTQTWWAKTVLGSGTLGVVLLPVGALGSRIGVWPFTIGFLLVAVGVVLSLVALLVGGVGLALAVRRGRRTDYPALTIGVVLSLLVLAGIGSQVSAATSVPPIHNISTDIENPPEFQAIVTLRSGANPHIYDPAQSIGDAGTLGELQRASYPDVETLRSTVGMSAGVERAAAILEGMGLELVDVDPARGTVEATATTFWFGFKDDVVVRVQEQESVTLIDLHSVSRVGQSDLGANASRILAFLERFGAEG